jgi:hypothetical protein
LIWAAPFGDRLRAWQQLRDHCVDVELSEALTAINRWWHQAPWTPYWLHWDDRADWPDPWQLLENSYLCPVARALGIMYTVVLLKRDDVQDAEMIEVNDHNLVLICRQKYILNWDPAHIVNIDLGDTAPRRRLEQHELAQNLL